jgi:hypothetical protein
VGRVSRITAFSKIGVQQGVYMLLTVWLRPGRHTPSNNGAIHIGIRIVVLVLTSSSTMFAYLQML